MPMSNAPTPAASGVIRLHHGTDLASGNDILRHGLDAARAASYNGSGEFWATADPATADWFAKSNPATGTPARFSFGLPEPALQRLLARRPFVVHQHSPDDYEFLPASFPDLNAHMANKQITLVP
jgi:hypothetical protein